jgi:hypothetical protein
VTANPGWLITRDRLIEAIAGMSLAGVPKWGAGSPAAWAEQLADGITEQLGEANFDVPRLVVSVDSELTPEKRDELVAAFREAMKS